MHSMTQTLKTALHLLNKTNPIYPASAGEYETIRLFGPMKFHVKRYDIPELGNLCIMTVNMGLMKMSTFVITPFFKNMPMLSIDYIYMGSSRKAYIEAYDLVENKEDSSYQKTLQSLRDSLNAFDDLESFQAKEAWYEDLLTVRAYKTGRKDQDDRFLKLFAAIVTAYGKTAAALPLLSSPSKAAKVSITEDYCKNMVEKGGMSTDNFKKALGDEVTLDFFNRVMFGPANYED